MRKTERDFEYLETTPEAEAAGLRRISRPKFLDDIPRTTSLRSSQSRIAIYLDADIVTHYKENAESEKADYQTLINDALRKHVDCQKAESEKENLKDELLRDKKFLRKLKTALAA